MNKIIMMALLSLSINANACNDSFKFATDKKEHMAGSALMAGTMTLATDNPWVAFGASISVGALKEAYDYRHPDKHCASWEDWTYDVAGSAVGAYTAYKLKSWYIQPKKNGAEVGYVKKNSNKEKI